MMPLPPYPLADRPGVHVILTPWPSGYGDRVVIATASRIKAAAAWLALVLDGESVQAQAWHGDRVSLTSWDRHGGLVDPWERA